MSDCYQNAGCEPPLEELLTDPIVKLLLERDGMDPAALRSYLCSLREKLQHPHAEAAFSAGPSAPTDVARTSIAGKPEQWRPSNTPAMSISCHRVVGILSKARVYAPNRREAGG